MRNLVLLLVVALLAVPAFADPVVYLQAGSSPELVDVMYDANGGSIPSGIGIDISVDLGSIVAVSGYGTGEYDIYPGQIVIVAGVVTDANTPVVGKVNAAGSTAVGAASAILEFGALYERGVDPAPVSPGKLCTIEVSANCTVTLAGDDARCGTGNGIIGEDLVGYAVADTLVVSLSSPTCWLATECAGQPNGDSTCDGSVNLADLFALKASWGKSTGVAGYNCCADFDQSGAVNLADLFKLKAGWGSSGYTPSTSNQACP